MNELGCDIKCRFEILSPENVELASQFDCGNEEINKYLRNESIHDDCGTTYLVIEEGTDTILAYCTFCASGLTAEFEQSIRTIPAIEVKYFALSVKVQKLKYDDMEDHYYFSDYIFGTFAEMLEGIAEHVIAAKYLILYAVPDAVQFYKRIGFIEFAKFYKPDNYLYINGCIPMYLEMVI